MRAAADESSPRITRQSSVPSGPSLLKDQSNCYAERGRGPGPRMSVSGQSEKTRHRRSTAGLLQVAELFADSQHRR